MEKLAILAMLVLMLSAPAIARMPAGSDTIAMVGYVDNVEEPIIEVMVEENGTLKCAGVLEDCFRTPCCSGLSCDLAIHARCVL
ncbi:hypothetical protein KSS87_021374 [Heliosperma pusillum]|nr:hypothetical protein KSS87_021374 [Heliosperma pusillum]